MVRKKAKRGTDEVEVCDSVTQNVQFDVNCPMISWKWYLINNLNFQKFGAKGGERAGGGKGESGGGAESREGERKAGEACQEGRQGEVCAKYCL